MREKMEYPGDREWQILAESYGLIEKKATQKQGSSTLHGGRAETQGKREGQ
jgi:hypothetical protein